MKISKEKIDPVKEWNESIPKWQSMISDENIPFHERVEICDRFVHAMDMMRFQVIIGLELKYKQSDITTMIRAEITERIDAVRKVRQSRYDDLDRMRKGGVPFSKRMDLFDEWTVLRCNKEESKLIDDSRRMVARPLHEWITAFDAERVSTVGLRRIIRDNLAETYMVPLNKKHHE